MPLVMDKLPFGPVTLVVFTTVVPPVGLKRDPAEPGMSCAFTGALMLL